MYDTVLELYKELLEIYFDELDDLWDAERKKINTKYNPTNLTFYTWDYSIRFQKEELSDTTQKGDEKEKPADISSMPPLAGDEEERKGLKILTPNKLLTRAPVLLAQIKAWNNLCKLKNNFLSP